MYSISFHGEPYAPDIKTFGDKYDLTDEHDISNCLVLRDASPSPVMLASKLLFAIADLGAQGSNDIPMDLCSFNGISVFRSGVDDTDTIECVKDFIENGNIRCSENLPDVSLGPFTDEAARISIIMEKIEQPIMMAAMMFSTMSIRAVAGGTKGDMSYALVSANEPVSSVPKVDGVLKVRVLQDI